MYIHNQIKTYSQKEATFTGSLNKLTIKKGTVMKKNLYVTSTYSSLSYKRCLTA